MLKHHCLNWLLKLIPSISSVKKLYPQPRSCLSPSSAVGIFPSALSLVSCLLIAMTPRRQSNYRRDHWMNGSIYGQNVVFIGTFLFF
ncbi:hypothetical protein GDO86_013355 [Hymenochirus boettgeri]|uniref:Uncharacterized protein n=1 Tax=Hymenochirus boettgeri TaxID=247094 RepID=A0A8T2IY28_9PIPI|nr:hypothetical protein GDO86_013355 [Hymenochirus boettgeri]